MRRSSRANESIAAASAVVSSVGAETWSAEASRLAKSSRSDLVGRGALPIDADGHDPIVGETEADPQERDREQQQHDARADGVRDRVSHDARGLVAPEPTAVRVDLEHAALLHTPAEHREHGGEHDDRS